MDSPTNKELLLMLEAIKIAMGVSHEATEKKLDEIVAQVTLQNGRVRKNEKKLIYMAGMGSIAVLIVVPIIVEWLKDVFFI